MAACLLHIPQHRGSPAEAAQDDRLLGQGQGRQLAPGLGRGLRGTCTGQSPTFCALILIQGSGQQAVGNPGILLKSTSSYSTNKSSPLSVN